MKTKKVTKLRLLCVCAESVAFIAELDFPNKWDNLVDVRPCYLFC